MVVLISLIVVPLVVWQIFLPTLSYLKMKQIRQYRLFEKAHKMKVIRAFIPAMHAYSLSEIEEKYGLDRLYNAVGRIRTTSDDLLSFELSR